METKLLQTNLKDVATSFYYCDNPEKNALEITESEEYRTLKDSNKEFLDRHINEALIRYYLNKLNYCVCQNPVESIKQILNAQSSVN